MPDASFVASSGKLNPGGVCAPRLLECSVRQPRREVRIESGLSFRLQGLCRSGLVSETHDVVRRSPIARPRRQSGTIRVAGPGEIRPIALHLLRQRPRSIATPIADCLSPTPPRLGGWRGSGSASEAERAKLSRDRSHALSTSRPNSLTGISGWRDRERRANRACRRVAERACGR